MSPVSVERGWSSKRDLIGYFNPLTKKYDKSNSKIYDALMILNEERNKSLYPFIIMLDEANLSPIEYYWADFMRLTDRSGKGDAYVNIGMDKDLYVPETLRFVATINTDQTTEQLSPRLIDRACIIKLRNVPLKTIVRNDENEQFLPIQWKNIISTFSTPSPINESLKKVLESIYSLFEACNMPVSPRIKLGIERYVGVAQDLMEDEPSVLGREKALDYAVIQKLLPKINGYYDNYKTLFEKLVQICNESHLLMTKNAIEIIESMQEQNMGYCQYLI